MSCLIDSPVNLPPARHIGTVLYFIGGSHKLYHHTLAQLGLDPACCRYINRIKQLQGIGSIRFMALGIVPLWDREEWETFDRMCAMYHFEHVVDDLVIIDGVPQ